MRIIPKNTKVKIEFFKNISVADVVIGLLGLGLIALVVMSNFAAKWAVSFILGIFTVAVLLPYEGEKAYMLAVDLFKFFAYRKRYVYNGDEKSDISNIIPFKGVEEEFIVYDDYYAGVLEIKPREFRLLSEYKQNQIIDQCFANVIKSVSGDQKLSIVKVDRPILFDNYILDEDEKINAIRKMYKLKDMSKAELDARYKILTNREDIYFSLNEENSVVRSAFYLVLYDADRSSINEVFDYAENLFEDYGVTSKRLDEKELAVFLKYNYTNQFDERQINFLHRDEYMDWILPRDIKFEVQKTIIDDEESFHFTVRDFPLTVANAWGAGLFNIKDTKVVFNIEPVDRIKAVKRLDRAVDEITSQSQNTSKTSKLLDQDTHMGTLVDLLAMLGNGNESLFETTLHFTIYNRAGATSDEKQSKKNNIKKQVRRIIAENGFKVTDNFGKQVQAFVSCGLSKLELLKEQKRGIHSTSIAACFPFVLNSILDDQGTLLGASYGVPVVLDMFKRDRERVNSNMVILGKSGSGKSFATKTLLSGLASENCKIFILDPENEYDILAKNLGGKLIDVGTAKEGRLNPFHIVTSLDADEVVEGGANSSFSVHLQFLEEYYRQILEGITSDALEYLNNLTIDMYKAKGIDKESDLSKLKAEDYPIFDDLFSLIQEELKNAKDDYSIKNLRILHNYVAKFAGNGRNANLWNGANTLTVKENFTVFNFQSLLANKNNLIANAQMLLVLKWLDNEIIKNRDFNLKYNTNRRIIVAIDEAHVFIDNKYPIALDFMYQLAKRIRKYNGMQIIITQNIKDFVGSPEIARKSTAIINACQYSFIFALAPNDMDDLCTLYEKAGQINKVEQDEIVNNPRGNAFLITSPMNRSNIEIIASPVVQKFFEEIKVKRAKTKKPVEVKKQPQEVLDNNEETIETVEVPVVEVAENLGE